MENKFIFELFILFQFYALVYPSLSTRQTDQNDNRDPYSASQVNVQEGLSDDLRSAITRMSLQGFLSSVMKDGRPMTTEDIYPVQNTSTGEKTYISGGSRLAMPDDCSPRKMSVVIPRSPYDPANYEYWPQCTMTQRCGGCCQSRELVCVPDQIEYHEIHVLRAERTDRSSITLNWKGPMAINLAYHVSCKVACRKSPLDCHVNEIFIPEDCTCVCSHRQPCTQNQAWDSVKCKCFCPFQRETTCSRDTVYDTRKCECVLSSEAQEYNIALDHDISQSEIDAYLNNQDAPTPSPPTTTTAATTTTTTTTVAPTVADVCRSVTCPRRWRKLVRNGRCMCQPRFG